MAETPHPTSIRFPAHKKADLKIQAARARRGVTMERFVEEAYDRYVADEAGSGGLHQESGQPQKGSGLQAELGLTPQTDEERELVEGRLMILRASSKQLAADIRAAVVQTVRSFAELVRNRQKKS